jgi:presenilin-like A22 family membrane protease
MKHTWNITLFLVLIFVCAQIVGIAVVNEYVDIAASKAANKTVVNEAAFNITGIAPPEVENESLSWIYILFAVLVGTVLVLLIIKFHKPILWKMWFALSVIVCLTVALAPFIQKLLALVGVPGWALLVTLAITGTLTYYKILRPNIFVHNISEVFLYGGLAALIVPVVNMVSAVLLLVGISIYDMYAVWKSKHMVTMAKFQTEAKMFAGLYVPYQLPKKGQMMVLDDKKGIEPKGERVRSAILGGGDIAFPLLFSGVILKATASFLAPLIVTVFAAIALFMLLYKGEQNKFYPAMPFISAGCFVGLTVVWLLQLF